jgi:hypothetical protein
MQNKPINFSPEEAMRLANTPAGQQLIALLQKSGAASINNAMSQAKDGNMEQAKKALAPILASPEVQKLLKELGGK